MKVKNETSAGGIVFKRIKNRELRNENIKWLICQNAYHKGWVFPKGLIEPDEPMNKAALREVEEEGGVKARIVTPKPIEISYTYKWNDSAHGKNDSDEFLVNKKVYYYLMEYLSGDPDNHDREMDDAKFISEKEVLKNLTFPADKEAFQKILQLFYSKLQS